MSHPLSAQIDTKRLCLRKPDLSDVRSIFDAYTHDAEVCRFMTWTPHASEATTQEFIELCIEAWNSEGRRPYLIEVKDYGTVIGMIEARMLGTSVDIGYVLARSQWGKGLMPEAICAMSGAALGIPEVFRIQATCDTQNIPSQRALEKSGFNREGRLERYMVHPNLSPEPRACFMYARVR